MQIYIIQKVTSFLAMAAVSALFCMGGANGQAIELPIIQSASMTDEVVPVDLSSGVTVPVRELKKKINKATKATKGSRPSSPSSDDMTPTIESIQGTYIYDGCDNNLFQATILCGVFGNDDEDLCLYQEFKLGQNSETAASADSVPYDYGGFFNPNQVLANPTFNPEDFCVYSGTFRASAALQGRNILPVPLATSNGCTNVKQNFQYALKIKVKMDGTIALSFSSDGGFTYYTDDVDCPKKYIGHRFQTIDEINEMENTVRRRLEHGRRLFWWYFVAPVAAPVAVGLGGPAVITAFASSILAGSAVFNIFCGFFC